MIEGNVPTKAWNNKVNSSLVVDSFSKYSMKFQIQPQGVLTQPVGCDLLFKILNFICLSLIFGLFFWIFMVTSINEFILSKGFNWINIVVYFRKLLLVG